MTEYGFTGTSRKDGMYPRQMKMVRQLMYRFNIDRFHHGDCRGADEQAHEIAGDLGIFRVVHPPTDPRARAFCEGEEIRTPRAYLLRNDDIAREGVRGLIAAPRGWIEVMRGSGTWATIRYARKYRREIWIVLPDGKIRKEVPKL